MPAKYGLLVPLVPHSDKEGAVADFLKAGLQLVQDEPDTIQWFAVKYKSAESVTYAIFDTFPHETGRTAHLTGKVAEALMANAPTLLSKSPELGQVDILANNILPVDGKLGVGIRVLITAKPEKVQVVRDFLVSAISLVQEEPETLVWYAIEFPGTNQFGIVDFFANETGRKAHLNGKVAAALFASVDELLTESPDLVMLDVLAAKVLT